MTLIPSSLALGAEDTSFKFTPRPGQNLKAVTQEMKKAIAATNDKGVTGSKRRRISAWAMMTATEWQCGDAIKADKNGMADFAGIEKCLQEKLKAGIAL